MKIITVSNWKGGTGKTTLTTAIIYILSLMMKKILIIDFDTNIAISDVFKMGLQNVTSIQLLNGYTVKPYKINDYIDIIPSDMRISKMSNMGEKELKNAIKNNIDTSGYDYIFIDPPGTMNALTRNALVAAEIIIVPAMPSSIDLTATEYFFKEMIEMELEKEVHVIINGNDPKKNTDSIYSKFLEKYDDFLYKEPIQMSKSLRRLTTDYFNYSLHWSAKRSIEAFIKEAGL